MALFVQVLILAHVHFDAERVLRGVARHWSSGWRSVRQKFLTLGIDPAGNYRPDEQVRWQLDVGRVNHVGRIVECANEWHPISIARAGGPQ